ncbi:MAG TPA: AMP-binding protein [Nocardioidaceae bacterium]|nr:AMP-binding protein [Nocardioidaceae bacterium]
MTDTVQKLLHALASSNRTALRSGDESWTWRELVAESTRRADALLGLAPDGPLHVGVLADNTPEFVMALCAGAIGGYVSVGINTTRRGEGLAADVRKADCSVLLVESTYASLLEGLDLGGARVIDVASDEWKSLIESAAPQPHRDVDTMDTFMLIFTSGTSGDPKAVQVSNFMVVMAGARLQELFSLTEEDVCYVSMPLFHSNAVASGFGPSVASGAAMALAPKFSASTFLADIRRYGATYLNYVGKPLAYVLATPRLPDDADNPLRQAFGNEASGKDQREFAERFGCAVYDGFGSTENAVIISPVPDMPAGSIGQPWDGVAVFDREAMTECPRAIFDEHGAVANLDEAVGEIVNTAGAGFFSGYYNDQQATDERMAQGMYWSGDLGYRDADGFMYLAGRTSDWLRVDGENLAAGPIEQILLRHPAVNRVAVYGIPDPSAGDQLVAAIVLQSELDPAGFEAFLAEQKDLSSKGWPRYVRIADDLPSTATNKVLKRDLIAQALNTTDELWEREARGTRYHRWSSSEAVDG